MANLTINKNYIPKISHPGKLIEREIKERGRSQKYFAELLGITTSEVNNIIKWRKNLTPRLAARIATSFETSVNVWLHLQNGYNLWMLYEDKKERERINKIKERLYSLSLSSFGYKRRELEAA